MSWESLRYLSVCSGIEAATVAWHPLGWEPVGFSEIEPFPCELLDHYYDAPNLGNMEGFNDWRPSDFDVLVGGTPCQSFSVAGLRKGLGDPRGNLALVYLAITDRFRPEWLVWENVPGVLSSNEGRDFGSFLGALVELGYGYAYRTLDAQYFGVPQRRRRVFVVGCSRGWQRAAAVLFERESLRRNPPPSRKAREGVTGPLMSRTTAGGGTQGSNAPGRRKEDDENLVVFAQNQRDEVREMEVAGAIASEPGMKQQTYVSYGLRSDAARDGEAKNDSPDAEGRMRKRDAGFNVYEETAPTVDAGAAHSVGTKSAVRRLTPRECERLQGFPDDYTLIQFRGKPASDTARYRALGNSMAVPVMRWIGERVQQVGGIR